MILHVLHWGWAQLSHSLVSYGVTHDSVHHSGSAGGSRVQCGFSWHSFHLFSVFTHLLTGPLLLLIWPPGRVTRERVWEVWDWSAVTSVTFLGAKASRQASRKLRRKEYPHSLMGGIPSATGIGERWRIVSVLAANTSDDYPKFC